MAAGFLNRRRRAYLLSGIIVMFLTAGSEAQEMPVPVNMQSALFAKVLPFNRALPSPNQKKIIIGIVYQSTFKLSNDVQEEFVEAMTNLPIELIRPSSYQLVIIDLAMVNLERSIVKDKIDVLYIAPLRAVNIGEITVASRARGVLTFTGVPHYVSAGISVGFGLKGGKPQILVNLKSTKLEHADFDSQFLKITRIIESEEVL